jgi:hypothetical protein
LVGQTPSRRRIFTLSARSLWLLQYSGTPSSGCCRLFGSFHYLGYRKSGCAPGLRSADKASFFVAFVLIGFPSLGGIFIGPRLVITRVATWAYAIASAAGFLQFGLNFGEEAGAATEVWITRACIVQGLQQIWGEFLVLSLPVRPVLMNSLGALVLGLHAQRNRSR